MLNIPDTVKALFKADGIRKNFRVHFPNGELNDLTNANIVQESVKFTESLCSQDVLKFGLTEASVIEFETVGVANMYGMRIECGIEIDLSSLSAADLAVIAAGSWDGTYVAAGDSDLGFTYFRVPYGVFRVESCPRDHQAMAHRQVQAYGPGGEIENSPFEAWKLINNAIIGNGVEPVYSPDVLKLLYAAYSWRYPKTINSLTKTVYTAWQSWPPSAATGSEQLFYHSERREGSTSPTETVEINVTIRDRAQVNLDFSDTGTPNDVLYSVELNNGSQLQSAMETIADEIDDTGSAFLIDYKAEILQACKAAIAVHFGTYTDGFVVDGDIPVFYPYFGKTSIILALPQACKIRIAYSPTRSSTSISYLDIPLTLLNEEPTVYQYSNLPYTFRINIAPTSSELRGSFYHYGYFVDSYDLTELANAMLEINAQFGRLSRSGAYELLNLSTLSPIQIIPGEYSGFWWDEYDVLPIGTIKYSFMDKDNNEIVIFYQFDSGGSLYDMTTNEILAEFAGADETAINAVLDTYFIPHLGPIAFTPIDLTMKGLPYIEAGDYLAAAAEDGETAYSFAMRQEISGVQILESQIESSSGDIIESEAST